MARKFKSGRKRKTWRRKTYRKSKRLSPYRQFAVHSFKRTVAYTISLVDSDVFTGYMFRLNDLPNYTEFVALYDQFKITGVKLKFIYTKNSADSQASNTQFLPNMAYITDVNDATGPLSLTEMEQYGSFKIKRLDQPVSVFIRPKVAVDVYQSTWTGYATTDKQPWVATASSATEWYGFKNAMLGGMHGGTGTNTLGKLLLFETFYIKCRSCK